MGMARLVEDDLRSGYYYVSRVADGHHSLGDEEKRFFRKTMRGLKHLTGVRILEPLPDAQLRPSPARGACGCRDSANRGSLGQGIGVLDWASIWAEEGQIGGNGVG